MTNITAPQAAAMAPSTDVNARFETAGPLNHTRTTATDVSTDSTLNGEEKNLDVHEVSVSNMRSPLDGTSFEQDLESGLPTPKQPSTKCSNLRKSLTLQNNTDCQMWPGQDHWKRKAKDAKKQRTCIPLAGLSKRQRIVAKVMIGILVIGIAVAVGFGVSKPLGASIWGDNHNNN